MASSQKKVVVRSFRDPVAWGYLPQNSFVTDGTVSLIDPAGRVSNFQMNDIKWIAYVRDFYLNDPLDPERLGRRAFPARPRAEGLWLRLEFRDGEQLEALVPVDAGLVTGIAADGGLFVNVPDARANAQRLFVPASALKRVEALGLVIPKKKSTGPKPPSEQEDLFPR